MMTKILSNSALLAIVLLGSAALMTAPALAKSYKHGNSGWNKNAQNDYYRKHNRSYGRSYGFNNYRGPSYGTRGYYYGSPYSYGPRPGFSITIR